VSKAVVLAGGRGTRLAPYTSILPKPLMPVGNRSILEHVVDQLEEAGITDLTFCVGYLSHLIRAVFDNRERGGVGIAYVQEKEALGTAGPLRLVEGLSDTFIVMNGDVLTNLDYTELVEFHRAQGALLTIATHKRAIDVPLGVLDVEDERVVGFREKPKLHYLASMGVYVYEAEALEYMPDGPCQFPDLVLRLVEAGRPVASFASDALWYDIGTLEEYERAARDFGERPHAFVK
jgi:NDP-sugar pyrophosphorylase family protein